MGKNLNQTLDELRRLPQVVLPKDAALILGYTGIPTNAKIVDAGSGSGFLAIFLAWYCPDGQITTYEKRKEFAAGVKKNIEKTGLENIKVKNKDILRSGIEEDNLDLVTLDMKDCEKVVSKAYKKLKEDGWLAVYSPHIEQVIKALEEMKKCKFREIKSIENITREWQSEYGYTRPVTKGITHTGWLSFGKK